jgi:hypothetical protein
MRRLFTVPTAESSGYDARRATKLWLRHLIAASVPGILFLADVPPWWPLGIGGCVMAVTYLSIGHAESKFQQFWLSPLSYFFFWYSVGYGFSAIYAANETYDTGHLTLVTQIVSGPDLAAGYLLSICGALALHAGYLWIRIRRSKKDQTTPTKGEERSPFLLWGVVMVLGIVSLMRPQYFDSIGVARAIMQLAPFGVMLSYCSLPRQYFRLNEGMYLFWFLLGNGVLIVAAFYDGSKYFSMLAFLPSLSALLVRQRWRKALPFVFAIGVLLYLFVVAPVLMRSRGITGVDSQLQKLEIGAEETILSFREDTFFAFQEETNKFLYRQFESTATGFIVSDVREHGFKYGETMANLTYAFIPRLIWPDKPIVTRGSWFTAYLGGSGSEEESKTSTGIYSAGELYWNFGIPGVIAGMFLMGVIFSYIASVVGDGPQQRVIPMIIFINVIARIVEQAAASEVFVLLIYLGLVAAVYSYFESSIEARRRSKLPFARMAPGN